jgi:hypothetical protein
MIQLHIVFTWLRNVYACECSIYSSVTVTSHGQPSLKSWLLEEREGVGEEEPAAGGEGGGEEGHPRRVVLRVFALSFSCSSTMKLECCTCIENTKAFLVSALVTNNCGSARSDELISM